MILHFPHRVTTLSHWKHVFSIRRVKTVLVYIKVTTIPLNSPKFIALIVFLKITYLTGIMGMPRLTELILIYNGKRLNIRSDTSTHSSTHPHKFIWWFILKLWIVFFNRFHRFFVVFNCVILVFGYSNWGWVCNTRKCYLKGFSSLMIGSAVASSKSAATYSIALESLLRRLVPIILFLILSFLIILIILYF